MELNGIWKPIGPLADKGKPILIKDGEMVRNKLSSGEVIKKAFTTEPNNSYKSTSIEIYNLVADTHRDDDIIYHLEEHDGHNIRIISLTTIEYDGRGLIVICEYIHEEDYSFVDNSFESNLKHLLNDREAVPMMRMPSGGEVPVMGMMGMMNIKLYQPAPNLPVKDDPWTCSCGHENNSGRFCGECGLPRT